MRISANTLEEIESEINQLRKNIKAKHWFQNAYYGLNKTCNHSKECLENKEKERKHIKIGLISNDESYIMIQITVMQLPVSKVNRQKCIYSDDDSLQKNQRTFSYE